MTHALKTWPEFFNVVAISGGKNFELRKDDRPYCVEDTILLQEYDPLSKMYTGKEMRFKIQYIYRPNGKDFGLKKGYCILALGPIEDY